jgi:hypothetical protein
MAIRRKAAENRGHEHRRAPGNRMAAIQPTSAALGNSKQGIGAHADRVIIMATAGHRCRDVSHPGDVCDGCRFVVGMMAMPHGVMDVVAVFVVVAVATEVDVRAALMLVGRRVADRVMGMRNRRRLEQQMGHKTQKRHHANDNH